MIESTDKPVLYIESGPNQDEIVPLGATTTLGRQPSSDVVVSEAGVSRQHAQIIETPEGYRLRDLASTNGTFVNQKRITGDDYILKDGDQIRLGPSEISLIFRFSAASTIQLTLTQPVALNAGDEGGFEIDPGEQVAVSQVESLEHGEDEVIPMEAVEPKVSDELYEGTIRLNVKVEGSMGLVVNFVQRLREKPELRLLRLANNREGGVNVWVGLREPISLQRVLGQIECVLRVSSPRGRDLSPKSKDPPLTVVLKETDSAPETGNDWTACVFCKEPIERGTTVCPHCRKTQA